MGKKESKAGGNGDFLFRDNIQQVDPEINHLIQLESERQARKLVMIASESICPEPVRRAVYSQFSNVYAEGYPAGRMAKEFRGRVTDYDLQMAYFRRYQDWRYYKGCEYADFVEALAKNRLAEVFATKEYPADKIFCNVQSLSGAAANNAVYEAFLNNGDTVMGADLTHGGHLTHGSHANRSGKSYNVVAYQVSKKTGRFEYEEIMEAAKKHRPRMIIGGFSAYPWSIDWKKMREIADAVGAILMADIAHVAGLVAAGYYPNPIGYADVVTFTTHKTMCGPRGAVILSTNEDYAAKLDAAVFPGEQGGPHLNQIAGKAVSFQLAKTPQFKELQKNIVENAKHLADCLKKHGLKLAYGGTDTHMLLIDLKGSKSCTGKPISGEMVSRLLDMCGLVCNKNTVPGDENAAHPSAVRLGTTWVTQRGAGKAEMEKIAEIVSRVICNVHTFEYVETKCVMGRAKLPLEIFEQTKKDIAELESHLSREDGEYENTNTGYPHYVMPDTTRISQVMPIDMLKKDGAKLTDCDGVSYASEFAGEKEEFKAATKEAALFDRTGAGVFKIHSERAEAFMASAFTADTFSLKPWQSVRAFAFDRDTLVDEVLVVRLPNDEHNEYNYLVKCTPEKAARVWDWLNGLSDAYILFNDKVHDVCAKIEGPVMITNLRDSGARVCLTLHGQNSHIALDKFSGDFKGMKEWEAREGKLEGVNAIVCRNKYGDSPDRYDIFVPAVDAAKVWTMLKNAGAVPAGFKAYNQLRTDAGLNFKEGSMPKADALYESHNSYFCMKKSYFIGQATICEKHKPKADKKIFKWEEKEQPLQRTPLINEHKKLTSHVIPFAGWEMPVWYSSIVEEHRAVRTAAGVFDVAHMGAIEVSGPNATRFLDLVTVNYVRWLRDGQSHYSYFLDQNGDIIDDTMIYRRAWDKYLVIVNASNADKDWAWLNAVNSGEYLIDTVNPKMELEQKTVMRNLKDPSSGKDSRCDLALQGPAAIRVLQELCKDDAARREIARIRRTDFAELDLMGINAIVARTGYTGSDIGYELYIHPDNMVRLWNLILEKGAKYGVKPAGLGSRDSTRIEAGLPLYGHELMGKWDITPAGAGYAAYVKRHKSYFIGKDKLQAKDDKRDMDLVRFRMAERNTRQLKNGDPVFNKKGQYVGDVTSSTAIEGYQFGLAYVKSNNKRVGTELAIIPLPASATRMPDPCKLNGLKDGDKTIFPDTAIVLSRFPSAQEKEEWLTPKE